MNLTERLKHYRMSQDEYELMKSHLGREPQGVEWALFSALWSEHCSYKSSKVHLKKFFNKSKRVLESFGENAGVIDLGEGERVAFKMESHNHPSFIEPYQGAATGVGGILRDIFTMGARPVALADYLCFGKLEAPRMKSLVDGVVRGIGGYGNCVGVPTITGQTEFHESYNNNILVNAMALGLFRPGEPIVTSKAHGVGNWVVYVGAKTGRDGIHGASMASESFDEKSSAKKPTVQIGDPFYEKLLIESCLEVMQKNLVVAIQDMGAAGLTSSSFEMASKGNVGLRMHLDKVPLRDSSMTPEDILLSESQERMLLICEPDKFKAILSVFENWGLDACVVGEVLKERKVELYWRGDLMTAIDPNLLTESVPQKNRPFQAWNAKNRVATFEQTSVHKLAQNKNALLKILSNALGTSRQWIYNQYDQRVGAKTVRDCEDSFGILRLPDSGRGLGYVVGCRPHVMRLDARVGGMDALIYPALELAAKGFEPLALTDCLNFGNPEKIEIMSEFVAAVEGLNEVATALETPVISGNVSFYNETLGVNITSTPATGVVGLRSGIDNIPRSQFVRAGEVVSVLSLPMMECSGLWAEMNGQRNEGMGGELAAKSSASFVKALLKINGLRDFSASRVVGKFGLGYTLARMCSQNLGVKTTKPIEKPFREVLYQVVLVGSKDFSSYSKAIAEEFGLAWQELGVVCADVFDLGPDLQLSTKEIFETYHQGLGVLLDA